MINKKFNNKKVITINKLYRIEVQNGKGTHDTILVSYGQLQRLKQSKIWYRLIDEVESISNIEFKKLIYNIIENNDKYNCIDNNPWVTHDSKGKKKVEYIMLKKLNER